MKVSDYIAWIEGISFGKKLPEAIYIHRDGQNALPADLQVLIEKVAAEHGVGPECNLLKLRLREPKISFLSYPAFFDDAHPSLTKAVTVDLLTGRARTIDYSTNPNPPILHRKESFLQTNHPRHDKFSSLTRAEEVAGLYGQATTIGFKLNWERLLVAKGLRIDGHRICKTESSAPQAGPSNLPSRRHSSPSTAARPRPTRPQRALSIPGSSPRLSAAASNCPTTGSGAAHRFAAKMP